MATADARGHLMRGQLLYHALRARGADPEAALKKRLNVWVNLLMIWAN